MGIGKRIPALNSTCQPQSHNPPIIQTYKALRRILGPRILELVDLARRDARLRAVVRSATNRRNTSGQDTSATGVGVAPETSPVASRAGDQGHAAATGRSSRRVDR